jgi:hypothetical protein
MVSIVFSAPSNEAKDIHRQVAVVGRPIAQLAEIIEAPAFHDPGIGQQAFVHHARRDGGNPAAGTKHRNRGKPRASIAGILIAGGVSPTESRARGSKRAGRSPAERGAGNSGFPGGPL